MDLEIEALLDKEKEAVRSFLSTLNLDSMMILNILFILVMETKLSVRFLILVMLLNV